MKKKNSYRWLIWIFLAVILIGVALWNILPPYLDRMKSEQDYQKLAEEYVSDESEPDDGKQKKKDWWSTDIKVEFDQLKTENPDIIGWIRFDDQDELGINYPIVYSGDNEKYLRKDIHGNEHMNNGSMFGSLKKYKDEGFWKKNQYFTVYTESTAYRYQIFSYEDAVVGGNVYKVGYQPGEEYQTFIDEMVKNSDFDTGIRPKSSNKILTLSTCTGNGYSKRFAVHAVCIDIQTTDQTKLKETDD